MDWPDLIKTLVQPSHMAQPAPAAPMAAALDAASGAVANGMSLVIASVGSVPKGVVGIWSGAGICLS
jgi:hypothetical protein